MTQGRALHTIITYPWYVHASLLRLLFIRAKTSDYRPDREDWHQLNDLVLTMGKAALRGIQMAFIAIFVAFLGDVFTERRMLTLETEGKNDNHGFGLH